MGQRQRLLHLYTKIASSRPFYKITKGLHFIHRRASRLHGFCFTLTGYAVHIERATSKLFPRNPLGTHAFDNEKQPKSLVINRTPYSIFLDESFL